MMDESQDQECGPIIDLPPPSPAARAAVERYVLRLVARRALIDLGLLPDEEASEGNGGSTR